MAQSKLPKDWKYKKLGEMFNFVGGGTPSKTQTDYWNGDINWASVKDVKGDFLNSTKDFITDKGLKNSASNLAEKGDVILITRISPGKSIITNIQTAINQDLKIAKPKFLTISKFIYYFFSAIERDCIKKSSGTTVLGITLNNLNELLIPNLSLEEQNTIVSKIEELFSELDKGIEDLKTAQLQLKTYRQSVLKYAFEGKLTNEKVKEGVLPKGWKKVTIGDICEMKAGKFVKATEINDNIHDGFYRCYGGNGLRGYTETYTHDGIHVLIGRQGALCGNVHLADGKFHATEHAVVVSVNKNINMNCLYYKLIEMRLNQYSSGVAQPGLSVNKLLPVNLIFPTSLNEQHQIVQEIESRLSVADKMEESIAQSLQQAEALRQSILKKAFSGELV